MGGLGEGNRWLSGNWRLIRSQIGRKEGRKMFWGSWLVCVCFQCMYVQTMYYFVFHSMIRLGLTILKYIHMYIYKRHQRSGWGRGEDAHTPIDRDILTLHKLHLPLIVLYKIIGRFLRTERVMIRGFFFCCRIRVVED